MRTLKERITDLESQIELLDKKAKIDSQMDSLGSRSDDRADSMRLKLKNLELQRSMLDVKIESAKRRLEDLKSDDESSELDSQSSRQEARRIKRERLMNQLKSLQDSYLNYMESIGRAPGTEGKDALDLIK
jgi:chromosome segregation ATPase